jgi:arylsulfatase A-like enzyme
MTTEARETINRPNIICIMTDQQSAYMMSCTGNTSLLTPALDGLANRGVRFERAYATNPVCAPSRFSLQTGRMPSAIGMTWNYPAEVPQKIVDLSLGSLFQNAGYETVYGGKVHLPGALNRVEDCGYRRLTSDSRQGLADVCAGFIGEEHTRPFLLFASFTNPHDICYLAINDALRANGSHIQDNIDSKTCEVVAAESRDIAETPEADSLLPALPANYGVSATEPEAISTEYLSHEFVGVRYRHHARENWGDKEWRVYRHAYRRLTEMVDSEIGQVLDAIRDAGLEEETLIVFTSDHGDMDGAHRLQHKSVLYDEAARVPFIISHQGVIPEGVVNDCDLISNGLDMLPTLCDAAGIRCPDGLNGRSVLPLVKGNAEYPGRDYVVVESLHGRSLRTDRFKYSIYASGKEREQLVDLKNDPGEMTNLSERKEYQEILNRHRRLLGEWIKNTGDKIAAEYVPIEK